MDELFTNLVVEKLREALSFPLDTPARHNSLCDMEHLLLPYADKGYVEWAKVYHAQNRGRSVATVETGRFLAELVGLSVRIGLFVSEWSER